MKTKKPRNAKVTTAMVDAGWKAGLRVDKQLNPDHIFPEHKTKLRKISRAVIEAALKEMK